MGHHAVLHSTALKDPLDYEPWGNVVRWADPKQSYPDCSHGCVWFYQLATKGKERLGMDWGVCANPVSHRCGKLTFEHQGCQRAEFKRKRASSHMRGSLE